MRSSRVVLLAGLVLFVVIGMSSGDTSAASNRWNAFSSPAFSQGLVRTSCLGQDPCQDEDFSLGGSIDVECPGPPGSGHPYECHARADSDNAWRISGIAGHLPGPVGDVIVGTFLTLFGERVDADLFTVSGTVTAFTPTADPLQVAVFQYFGDPAVFDGLEVDSVQELVDLGIISSDDILAVEMVGDLYEIDMQVQVTGLSDEEIVVFVAGDGRIPPNVPATTTVGTAVLLLVMLVTGTWALRRRTARAD